MTFSECLPASGVRHSEYNHSKTEDVHFLQIWILPSDQNITPSYEQKRFSEQDKSNKLKLVVSKDGRDGSLSINQNVNIYASILAAGSNIDYALPEDRHVWLQVAKGNIEVNNEILSAGDAIYGQDALNILAKDKAEFLLFDLA